MSETDLKKYAVFSDQGLPTAFYVKNIHGDNIPENAVEISHEQWLDFINNPNARCWNGSSVVNYEPPAPSQEDLLVLVRSKRNALLAGCDWTILADSPLNTAQKNAWKSYRQQLRDITKEENLESIQWPDSP